MLGSFTGSPFNPRKSVSKPLVADKNARWRQNGFASCRGVPNRGINRLQAAFTNPSVTCCWLSVRREMGDLGSMLLGCGRGEGALGVWWHKTTAIGAGSEIPGQRNRKECGDDTQSGKSRFAIRARSESDPLRGSPADDRIAFRATPKDTARIGLQPSVFGDVDPPSGNLHLVSIYPRVISPALPFPLLWLMNARQRC